MTGDATRDKLPLGVSFDEAVGAARFGSGRSVARIEDDALLRGRGRFTDNVFVADAATIAFLRSPHPHARIDMTAAKAMPGVLAVFSGADLVAAGVKPIPSTPAFKRADGRTTVSPARHALAHEFARYVGEPVAAVIAEGRHVAQDALDAIAIEFEELPAVTHVEAATRAGAPAVTSEAADNIAAEMRHGDSEATKRRPWRSPKPNAGRHVRRRLTADAHLDAAAHGSYGRLHRMFSPLRMPNT